MEEKDDNQSWDLNLRYDVTLHDDSNTLLQDINDWSEWEPNFNKNDDGVDETSSHLLHDKQLMPDNTDLRNSSCSGVFDDVPREGMMFDSDDQLFNFYNNYARRIGFSVRKGHVKLSKNGDITNMILLCSKEGVKEKHKRGTPQKERPLMCTECMARIQCSVKSGTFVITKFIAEHNHLRIRSCYFYFHLIA
ncbi:hypothetical protein MKW92_016753 [Papaver armeniacum]|nr:hypothetical protein MKW92_016753 [Papaver armeniacum]